MNATTTQRMAFQAALNKAYTAILEAEALLPRKHRLEPDNDAHLNGWISPDTFKYLLLSEEGILAASELNQTATLCLVDPESPPSLAEQLQPAILQTWERETQRRHDSEHRALVRMGLEPQGIPPRKVGDTIQGSASKETIPFDDCHPLSTKTEH